MHAVWHSSSRSEEAGLCMGSANEINHYRTGMLTDVCESLYALNARPGSTTALMS